MISRALLLVETILLLSVAALYIIQCPFNKVEESFNTQAVHDIINIFPNHFPHNYIHDKHDIDKKEISLRSKLPWDHMQYPGAVPRTFIGAIAVGIPLKFFSNSLLGSIDVISSHGQNVPELVSQFILQICSRFSLALFLVMSLTSVTRALHKRFGLGFRICFLFTTVSQFHYLYYAGRFLPNTYACILANLVFSSWISRQFSKSLIYIAISVLIFRFDTSLFFGCLLFDAVFIKKLIPISRLLGVGIPSGLLAIAATVMIDSFFWSRLSWPEAESLYFNVWLNKSHEWGVKPYFWYIYSCLLRILMFSSPFLVLADHKITRDFFIPTLAFILIYSILPHKELRFILFIAPFLNICVVSGLMNLHYYLNRFLMRAPNTPSNKKTEPNQPKQKVQRSSRIAGILFVICMATMMSANIFSSYILTRVSSYNYPGGHAALSLSFEEKLVQSVKKSLASVESNSDINDYKSNVAVYVNNLAAQTGVNRFVQIDGTYYSKTPEIDSTTFHRAYDLIYLMLEPKEISRFLKIFCGPDLGENGKLAKIGLAELKSRNREQQVTCNLPNQASQSCSIIDTIKRFQSINIGGLLNNLKASRSLDSLIKSLDDSIFIRTRPALHIISCVSLAQ